MTRPGHDVVIVGGGPAGLSLGLHLLHRRPALRSRVVLLEKSRYPREKYCAGAIGARGEAALNRIGVEVDVPSALVDGISVRLPGGEAVGRRSCVGRVVRRLDYDAELARLARARGLRVVEGARVTAVEPGPDGVRVVTDQGELRSQVVVGADGVGSAVRRAMGLDPGVWRAQVLEVDTEPSPLDPPPDLLHFDLSDGGLDGYFWDFPTVVDGRRLACRGVYRLVLPGRRAADEDLEARLGRYLAGRGLDLSACRKKRYAERGFSPHEPAASARLLLIGEAAGIDPITGEGIAQALLYGEVAAGYLLDRLGRGDLTFADWPRALGRTRLGLDLRIRHEVAARFFGPARPFFERAFLSAADVLPLGLDYFAGRPLDRRVQARAGLDVAREAWRHRALSPLRPWLRP